MIAIDGVIAHLAGALNIPTWVMVDVNPYWGWGRQGRDTVWYPSVRIYRQEKMHSWTSAFKEIREDLKCVCAYRTALAPAKRITDSLPVNAK